MNKKRVIVIPSRSKFENGIGITGRKINAGILTTNNNNSNASLMESALYQLRHLNMIINDGGNQSGSQKLTKLHELFIKGEINVVICYSKEDIERYKVNSGSSGKSIVKYDIPYYCINECILIKEDQVICLS